LKPPCMLVTAHVLPAVRVIVARNLIEIHELKPVIVASKMGLTPAAVTQYVSGVRGGKLVDTLQKSRKMKRILDRLTRELLKTQLDTYAVMPLICELCRIAREEHMLCDFCDFSEAEDCDICERISTHGTGR